DGVSLTINQVMRQKKRMVFKVFLIPHTLKLTNLKDRKVGDLVNLEVDWIARWSQTFVRNNKPQRG
ncbi:MAG: riboflavin synthase, partial [Deltaproteobacteria bacterium]|nr:riboflavin synthase [Deltaproteobacteria bacterium]